ncbi:MAG: hypothetical protein WCN95_12105 [bacterium]
MVRLLQIERLPWLLVWIMAALEGVTVSILPYVSNLNAGEEVVKPPQSGLLLGYLGLLTAVILVNAIGSRMVNGTLAVMRFTIKKPFLISIWGSVFLALLFLFQSVFMFSHYNTITVVIRAICSISLSTVIFLLLYRVVSKTVPILAVVVLSGGSTHTVRGGAVLPAVIYLALYEGIALPIIEQIRGFPHYRMLVGLGLGLAAGAIAAVCVISIYNTLAKRVSWLKLGAELENLP